MVYAHIYRYSTGTLEITSLLRLTRKRIADQHHNNESRVNDDLLTRAGGNAYQVSDPMPFDN
jgi:hypothetical protein